MFQWISNLPRTCQFNGTFSNNNIVIFFESEDYSKNEKFSFSPRIKFRFISFRQLYLYWCNASNIGSEVEPILIGICLIFRIVRNYVLKNVPSFSTRKLQTIQLSWNKWTNNIEEKCYKKIDDWSIFRIISWSIYDHKIICDKKLLFLIKKY